MTTTSGKDSPLFNLRRTLLQSLVMGQQLLITQFSVLSVPDPVSMGRAVVMELFLRNPNTAYRPLMYSCQSVIGRAQHYTCVCLWIQTLT